VKALLHAELLKLSTTRTFVVLVLVSLALSLLVVVLTTTLSSSFTADEARDLVTADFTSLFILLLGVMGMAGEWRHRTITSTVLAAPDRTRLVIAKVLAYATAGAVLSLIVTVVATAVGMIILTARDFETAPLGDLLDVLWRNLTVSALTGALGVCVGGIVRNQVAAIVGLLVFSFLIEPAVLGLAPDVGRFGALSGAPAGIQDVEFFGAEDEDLLAPGVAVLVMLAWIAVLGALAAATLRHRDLV
jgi:hypothetical protein